ncbi:MoxR family ATPase [Thioalkalicoccus limnaeus]|uniref:MoxR family ATPase n=1 Tax=Thioalkalicoccus limnaeus TaxID=120681 RepID=A0ABV4BF56_9GAMM
MTEATSSRSAAIVPATPPAGGPQDDCTPAAWAEIDALRRAMHSAFVGQQQMVEMLWVALLSGGHLLIEGPPGLAKSSSLELLAAGLEGPVRWQQVSPDMDPARLLEQADATAADDPDAAGTDRWPASLLIIEGMEQATAGVDLAINRILKPRRPNTGIGDQVPGTGAILVMATRNPSDAAAPLPSWFDSFAFCVQPRFPGYAAERAILRRSRQAFRTGLMPQQPGAPVPPRVGPAAIRAARQQILDLHLSPDLEGYLVHLVMATRVPATYHRDLVGWLGGGVSPRATLALERGARAKAWLDGRDYVAPEDIQWIAPAVLRHRIRLTDAATADGRTPDDYIANWLARVPIP